MRILLVHNYYRFWGGEDGYFESLKKLLEKNHHTVIVYTKDSKNIKTVVDKVKVVLGMFWNRKVQNELRFLLKKEKIDVVQIQNIFPLITPIIYGVLFEFKIPILQRISNYRLIYPEYHNSKIATLIFRVTLFCHRLIGSFNYINTYIFPSTFIRDDFINFMGISKSKMVVISTFIDEAYCKRKMIKEKDYFLYVGRLSEEKGVYQLLDLFSKLPTIKLVVIGEGPLKNDLAKYRQYKNIILKGYLQKEEIYNYYSQAIATIIPSSGRDVFPTVILESFHAKTPVIVPRRDIFVHVVKSNASGLFYIQNNYSDLRKKIIFAYNNRGELKKMGEEAYKEYVEKYSKRLLLKKLEILYSRLLTT